jgi:hypothetical protein
MPNLCIEITDNCYKKMATGLFHPDRHKSIAALFDNNFGEEDKLRAKFTHILPSFQGTLQDWPCRIPQDGEENEN